MLQACCTVINIPKRQSDISYELCYILAFHSFTLNKVPSYYVVYKPKID